jgi:nicotinamidase-related amidase
MLSVDHALVAMIDIQENHFPHVLDGDAVLDRTSRFIRAARILDVPVVWTEHYPKAFGPTLPSLREAMSGFDPISKTAFGCFGEPRFVSAVEHTGRKVLYLVGSETHICIQQTALGALEHGLDVVLLVDCVTARARSDHEVALERLTTAGVTLTTWEAVVYEWMRISSHPGFKQVLPLVKGD